MLSCEKIEKLKMEKKLEAEVFLNGESENLKVSNDKYDDEDYDTTCGFGFFKGKFIQKLASKKSFLVTYSLTHMLINAAAHYYSATITTLEKHYKFTSAQTAYIAIVFDVVATIVSLIAPHYCSRSHSPRWMGVAVVLYAFSCFVFILPYILYGAGNDALSLTEEFGDDIFANSSLEFVHQKKMSELCYENKTRDDCLESNNEGDTHLIATIILMIGNGFHGIGGALFFVLGMVYIDDNVKKSKVPLLYSLTSFIKYLSPAIGYNLASFVLKFYVTPTLHPKINDQDPRWIGAWWIGYIVFIVVLLILAPIIAMFPKRLPRAALRKKQELLEKLKKIDETTKEIADKSSKSLMKAFKRLLSNKTYVCNSMAGIFYCFGYVPFFFFQAKYIQIHFLFSASKANMITGTVSLIFAAVGLLVAGVVITIFKPRARSLAMWNIISSSISVIGIIAYGFFSCAGNHNNIMMENSKSDLFCNTNCNCDYVKYAPICGENNLTYISSCHAGCTNEMTFENGTNLFTNCRCINSTLSNESLNVGGGGTATPGACAIDCFSKFLAFFFFLCLNKFLGGTEGCVNFLLGMRCVKEKDKATAMGFSTAVYSFFGVVPSPIIFGWLIDRSCIYWGKTCSAKGNCWLYDTEKMRYTFNMVSAASVFIGTLWDVGTWYYSKNIEIFDKKTLNKSYDDDKTLNKSHDDGETSNKSDDDGEVFEKIGK